MSHGLWAAPLEIGDWWVLVVDHRSGSTHERNYLGLDRRIAELDLVNVAAHAVTGGPLVTAIAAYERGDFTVCSDPLRREVTREHVR